MLSSFSLKSSARHCQPIHLSPTFIKQPGWRRQRRSARHKRARRTSARSLPPDPQWAEGKAQESGKGSKTPSFMNTSCGSEPLASPASDKPYPFVNCETVGTKLILEFVMVIVSVFTGRTVGRACFCIYLMSCTVGLLKWFLSPQERGECARRGVAGARVHLQDPPAPLPNSPLAAPGAARPRSRRGVHPARQRLLCWPQSKSGRFSKNPPVRLSCRPARGLPQHQHLSLSSASQLPRSPPSLPATGGSPCLSRARRGSL